MPSLEKVQALNNHPSHETLYPVHQNVLHNSAEVVQVGIIVSHSLKGCPINQTLYTHSVCLIEENTLPYKSQLDEELRIFWEGTKPHLLTPSRFFLWVASCSLEKFSALLPLPFLSNLSPDPKTRSRAGRIQTVYGLQCWLSNPSHDEKRGRVRLRMCARAQR